MSTEIQRTDGAAIAPSQTNSDLMAVIARAASDATVDVDKMERLFALVERQDANARRAAYFRELAIMQGELPVITKTAKIIVKGVERSRYAPHEDIDRLVRPFMAKYGFAFTFDTPPPVAPKTRVTTCTMTHREGHSETLMVTFPEDNSDFRSAPQNAQSVDSYAKRQLIKNHLNLVESGHDNDGNGPAKSISQKQADELNDLLTEIGGDEKARFLRWAGVAKVADVPVDKFDRGIAALLKKRSGV